MQSQLSQGITMYQIGEVTKKLKLSADTLRYYEKIALLKPIARSESGIRNYSEKDLSRLRFIKRAQKMGFSLQEISKLLSFRESPQKAKPEIRILANEKLLEVESHLKELQVLRNELKLLVGLCTNSLNGCPIIDDLDGNINH